MRDERLNSCRHRSGAIRLGDLCCSPPPSTYESPAAGPATSPSTGPPPSPNMSPNTRPVAMTRGTADAHAGIRHQAKSRVPFWLILAATMAQGAPGFFELIPGRCCSRRGRVGGGQHPIEQMVLDVLPRNVADGIAEIEELADVVAAAVGIADQGQCQRIAQRLGDGAARLAAQAAGELAPSTRRWVKLDARQVVRRCGSIDGLQFQRGGTLQKALLGRSRHLETAGQDHDTQVCLLAQGPQGDRPQLLRDLIEPIQDHRDPAGRPRPDREQPGVMRGPVPPWRRVYAAHRYGLGWRFPAT